MQAHFATTVTLSNDVSIESISRMLGHKNLRTTQHYAKILDHKVSNNMPSLFVKYENKVNSEDITTLIKSKGGHK